MGQVPSILIGTIAGLLRLGPFVITELFAGKKLSSYEPTEELGASLFRHHTSGDGSFKDVYFKNPVDGIKLHAVVDTGDMRQKGKRPIVFVHGFPELWVSWMDQLDHFSKQGHPVLALDMRGYGLSEKPKGLENYDVQKRIIEDIRAAVLYLKNDANETPLLVAHDWGAGVCWAYACQGNTTKNKEIAGYVTLAIPPGEMFEAKMGLKQFWASLYMLFFNMPWLPEFIMLFNNAWLIQRIMNTTSVHVIPAWMNHTYRANTLQNNAMTAQLNYYRAAIQTPSKPAPQDVLGPGKRTLDLPVLMLRGMDDGAITGDLFEGYEDYLSDARLFALDNCSHWIQADCPGIVHREIHNLLDVLQKKTE